VVYCTDENIGFMQLKFDMQVQCELIVKSNITDVTVATSYAA